MPGRGWEHYLYLYLYLCIGAVLVLPGGYLWPHFPRLRVAVELFRLPGCPIAGCGPVISAYHTGCPLSSGDTDLLYITSLLVYRYTG